LATADLQRALQAFHEFRGHVNGKQHGRTRETPPKKNLRKKLKHPIVKTSQAALFRASTKTKVLAFVRFDSCPCVVDENWERK